MWEGQTLTEHVRECVASMSLRSLPFLSKQQSGVRVCQCVCEHVCVEAVKQDCVYSSKTRLAVCVCDESQPDTAGGLITLPESVCA